MNQEKCIQIALFRYGIISDFANRKYMARGEKEELLRNKSSCIWEIPHSDRKYIAPSTILNWIQRYENGGRSLEALFPHPRCDTKISRTIDKISGENLIQLLKRSTISSVQNLINEMRMRGLVKSGTSLKLSNVYRFLKNHGLILQRQFSFKCFRLGNSLLPVRDICDIVTTSVVFDDFYGSFQSQRIQRESCRNKPLRLR